MRNRNKFHSNALASWCRWGFLSVLCTKIIKVLTEAQPGVHSNPSVKKSFESSVQLTRYSWTARHSGGRARCGITVSKFFKTKGLAQHGAHTQRSGTRKQKCKGGLDFVRWLSLGTGGGILKLFGRKLGRRCAVTENKTGCFVIRIWMRQKSLKPKSI